MSDNGVTIEQIADLVGHRTTIVTQKVYRHQLKPVISTGATAMNTGLRSCRFSCGSTGGRGRGAAGGWRGSGSRGGRSG
jgi:hypothetical protein